MIGEDVWAVIEGQSGLDRTPDYVWRVLWGEKIVVMKLIFGI